MFLTYQPDVNLSTKGERMATEVQVGDNEPLDKALRRLKKKIEREGIMKILKARKHYEKPSEVKRRKLRSAKKRKFF